MNSFDSSFTVSAKGVHFFRGRLKSFLRRFSGVSVLPVLFVASLQADHFIAVGAGEDIPGLYFNDGEEMIPVTIKRSYQSIPYAVPADSGEIVFYRQLEIPQGEIEWMPVAKAAVDPERELHVLLFFPGMEGSGEYSVGVFSDDLREDQQARMVFLNLTPSAVAVGLDREIVPLRSRSFEVVEVDLGDSSSISQEVRLAFYLKPEWKLFYSTRWVSEAGSRRLIFIRLNDRDEMEVDYIDLGMEALRRAIGG